MGIETFRSNNTNERQSSGGRVDTNENSGPRKQAGFYLLRTAIDFMPKSMIIQGLVIKKKGTQATLERPLDGASAKSSKTGKIQNRTRRAVHDRPPLCNWRLLLAGYAKGHPIERESAARENARRRQLASTLPLTAKREREKSMNDGKNKQNEVGTCGSGLTVGEKNV